MLLKKLKRIEELKTGQDLVFYSQIKLELDLIDLHKQRHINSSVSVAMSYKIIFVVIKILKRLREGKDDVGTLEIKKAKKMLCFFLFFYLSLFCHGV